jgi:hypothetical protein
MLRRTVAMHLLSRLAVDAERTPNVLICDREQLVCGEGIPSGQWGLALSFVELARADPQPRWTALAQRLAEADCAGAGEGLFGGPEGQRVALTAAGIQCPTPEADSGSRPKGDLMDGGAGIAWTDRCLGRAAVRPATSTCGDAEAVLQRLGLAHGELGIAAAYADTRGDPSVARLRELTLGLSQAGWCNGVAGVAVAALLANDGSADSDYITLAREAVLESLAMPRLETDGLCHGAMGVLVVGAAMARVSDNRALEAQVHSAADAICRRIRREGWRLETSRVADQSWLTGVAGIAWALLVIDSRPIVNPLCPVDAVLAQRTTAK